MHFNRSALPADASSLWLLYIAFSFLVEGALAAGRLHAARQGPTPTSSSRPSIIPSPILVFDDIGAASVCSSIGVSWFYNGPADDISIVVSNVGVSQSDPPPPLSVPPSAASSSQPLATGSPLPASQNITIVIADDIDPQARAHTWSPVVLPEGWYVLIALMPTRSFSQISSNFFVRRSPDAGCLAALPSTTADSPTSTSTGTLDPQLLPSSTASRMNVGAIVGVSVSAALLAAIVVGAWVWIHRKRKAAESTNSEARPPRWNTFSSNSQRPLTSRQSGMLRYQHSKADSMGTVLASPSEEGLASEKFALEDPSHSPIHHHTPKTRAPGASRTYSAASSITQANSINDYAIPPGRRPSVPESAITRRSLDSTSYPYPPVPPSSTHMSRSDLPHTHSPSNSPGPNTPFPPFIQTASVASSVASHSPTIPTPLSVSSSPSAQSPLAGVGEQPMSKDQKHSSRQSQGGRKRKPVPAYDPDQESSSSPSFPLLSTSASSVGHLSSSPSHTHELSHKSSFGPGGIEGKPLHYLIPDMPISPKE